MKVRALKVWHWQVLTLLQAVCSATPVTCVLTPKALRQSKTTHYPALFKFDKKIHW
jgi:hypothetical protein